MTRGECPSCGAGNPARARFCGTCGRRLGEPSGPAGRGGGRGLGRAAAVVTGLLVVVSLALGLWLARGPGGGPAPDPDAAAVRLASPSGHAPSPTAPGAAGPERLPPARVDGHVRCRAAGRGPSPAGCATWGLAATRGRWQTATIAGGSVYATTGDAVVAVALDGGAVRWSRPAGSTDVAPVVAGGVVLVADGSYVRGLDPGTGRTRWTNDAGGRVGRLLRAGRYVTVPPGRSGAARLGVVAVTGRGVVALDVRDGRILWTRATGGFVDAAAARGVVVVAGSRTGLVARTLGEGTVRWRRGGPVGRLALSGGVVTVGAGDVLTGLGVTDGAPVWRREGLYGPPLAAGGDRIAAYGAGRTTVVLVGARPGDRPGRTVARVDAGNVLLRLVAAPGARLYGGQVNRIVRLADGRVDWHASVVQQALIPEAVGGTDAAEVVVATARQGAWLVALRVPGRP